MSNFIPKYKSEYNVLLSPPQDTRRFISKSQTSITTSPRLTLRNIYNNNKENERDD